MKYLISLYVIIFNCTILFSQNQIVVESNLVKITYSYIQPLANEAKIEAFLYCNEKTSQFIFQNPKKTFITNEGIYFTNGYRNIINNYSFDTKNVEEQRTLEDGTVLYASWQNDIDWEITNDERTIGNFKVRKAITDSFNIDKNNSMYTGKAIAWFCPDIPIPSGPGRYYGLPGLIIKLSFENADYYYELENMEMQSEYQFEPMNKENVVEKEDVVYYLHKNQDKIKEIRKKHKKNKK